MARSADDPRIFWMDPEHRGILPLSGFRISRSLRRAILKQHYDITLDRDFDAVVAACADRAETWINKPIQTLYSALHDMGHAHSLELWDGADLVGGVYGVTLGTAFFGESMFSRRRDASKIALAYLVRHLANCGFTLFDTQYLTEHLASLGAIEIPRTAYHQRLYLSLDHEADILSCPLPDAYSVVQRSTQTS